MNKHIKEQIISLLDGAGEYNLEKVLVLVGARYDVVETVYTNIESKQKVFGSQWERDYLPDFNFSTYEYRLILPEQPQEQENKYIPFTVETFVPYREYWFYKTSDNIACRVVGYSNEGVTLGTDIDLNFYTWSEFMEFHLFEDGTPAGIEVDNE